MQKILKALVNFFLISCLGHTQFKIMGYMFERLKWEMGILLGMFRYIILMATETLSMLSFHL